MIFNDLLDVRLHFGRNVARRNLLEQRALSRCQVLTEFSLPLGDLVYGDRVQLWAVSAELSTKWKRNTHKAVNSGVDDWNLDLHSKRLILTLLE